LIIHKVFKEFSSRDLTVIKVIPTLNIHEHPSKFVLTLRQVRRALFFPFPPKIRENSSDREFVKFPFLEFQMPGLDPQIDFPNSPHFIVI